MKEDVRPSRRDEPPPDGAAPAAAGLRLLEVHHVAHRLSYSDDFVRRLLRAKKLPGIRLFGHWRIDARDLESFIDGMRTTIL